MRILQSSIIRAICAIIVGYLLVMYRSEMVQWLTIAIGAMFFISGIISLIVYYTEKRRVQKAAERLAAMGELRTNEEVPGDAEEIRKAMTPSFPIVGLGSIILGVILAIMPTTFVTGVMYVLAAIVILGAINQFFNLVTITKIAKVPFLFWIFPAVLLIVGILMVIKPTLFAEMPFRVMGWCLVLYGVVECVNGIKIYLAKKEFAKTQQRIEEATAAASAQDIEDAVVVEENTEDPVVVEKEKVE